MNTSAITIHQGDTWKRTATFTFAEDEGTLVGAKLWMTLKRRPKTETDEQAALQLDSDGNGITIIDETTAEFEITPAQSGALAGATYFYDIQVLLSTGEIYTTDNGSAVVTLQVTRATS